MKNTVTIGLGMLTFASAAFAETLPNNTYQCDAVLEGRGVSIQSKFFFDGNSAGTSFDYLQSYRVFVYKDVDENAQARIMISLDGSLSGKIGYAGYPIYQSGAQSPIIVTFNILNFRTTIKVTCEKE